jgi:hypothetical protein
LALELGLEGFVFTEHSGNLQSTLNRKTCAELIAFFTTLRARLHGCQRCQNGDYLQFHFQKRLAGDPLKISRKELVATDDLSASFLLTVVNVYQEGSFDVGDINAIEIFSMKYIQVRGGHKKAKVVIINICTRNSWATDFWLGEEILPPPPMFECSCILFKCWTTTL